MKTILNTKFLRRLLFTALSLSVFVAVAQEEESPLTISGSVDAYLRTTFADAGDASTATATSFANETGFALGMANLIASYESGDAGVVIDLVFGPRGAQATFVNDVVDGVVNQAYAYWNISEGTTLTVGRWNTFLGYEVIAPASNFNYSVSYLFSNGPFSHLGAKLDFALSDDVSLMLAVTNPWDTNNITGTGEYALGAQLGVSGQYLNLYYDSGKEAGLGFEIDYTGGFDLSDSFFLGINAAYNTNSNASYDPDPDNDPMIDDILGATSGFYGVALYPQITCSDAFAIGLRGELFQPVLDEVEGMGDMDLEAFTALTLTGSITKDNFILKPELRLDSSEGAFTDADGMSSDSLFSFTLAAIYSF